METNVCKAVCFIQTEMPNTSLCRTNSGYISGFSFVGFGFSSLQYKTSVNHYSYGKSAVRLENTGRRKKVLDKVHKDGIFLHRLDRILY